MYITSNLETSGLWKQKTTLGDAPVTKKSITCLQLKLQFTQHYLNWMTVDWKKKPGLISLDLCSNIWMVSSFRKKKKQQERIAPSCLVSVVRLLLVV